MLWIHLSIFRSIIVAVLILCIATDVGGIDIRLYRDHIDIHG